MATDPPLARKPVLTSERVVLRPFEEGDLPAMAAAIGDPDVRRLTGSVTSTAQAQAGRTESDAELRDWYLSRAEQPDRMDLAVVDVVTGRCVGEVVLNEWDPGAGSCNFRILLAPEGQGRGLGTEATALLIEHAFAVGLARITLTVFTFNPRAIRAYERVGFAIEGTRQRALRYDGVWQAEHLMAIHPGDPRPAAPVLEQVELHVREGQEAAYEAAFAQAAPTIRRQTGCRSVRLVRSVEHPSHYVLSVEWARIEDHTVGFRGSADYEQWRALLHPFYEQVPPVDHYVHVHRS
ncbi:GNAT family N-acetyltransferase [Allobranchiibius sp. CTAmp26]|uniref:GNAT family N-acetyltransferase n=1 Tax=Allobranchiibius sp. CTAmp26 TaxID=2815214 RepID=UPI001AA16FF3|nr:GNAT family N-acetyltransferase [Allobranchiibius sp. CTAmp26]MBO1755977.1 GNAT family N-acetyltransferase [Allobranchiibius sp. CTAmp26]